MFLQSHRTELPEKEDNLTVPIFQIPEYSGISGACFNTVWEFSPFNPVVAEGALFHNAFGPHTRQGRFSLRIVIGSSCPVVDLLDELSGRCGAAFNHRFIIPPELEGFLPVEVDYPVGTIKHTVPTADTLLGVMHGYPIVELVHGCGGAAPDTGGVLTVVTKCWDIVIPDVRKRSMCFSDFVRPEDSFR